MDKTSVLIYAVYMCSYFAFMIGVGFYHARRMTTVDEYLIAGWKVGFWKIAGTTVATWCGAAVFIGYVGMGFTSGVTGFFFWVLPGAVFSIVFVVGFARVLRRLQRYTIADAFALRFGKSMAVVPALFQILIYAIPVLALQFIGMGTIFKTFFGFSLQTGILIGFALIFVYTYMGGMPSTITTDAIQTVILFVGIFLLLVFSFDYAGGAEHIMEITPSKFWHPLGGQSFSKFITLALTVGSFYMVWQCTWQRVYAAKSESVAVRGLTFGFAVAILASSFSFLIGIMARGYLPLETAPDMVFTTAISTTFHPLIGGLIAMGLAAALMSGGDSFIMMGSASITRDIYQQYFNPEASAEKMLKIARISVVFMSLVALVIALYGKGIIPMYLMIVKTCGAATLFPFFALMFWKGATRKGIVAGMITGAVVNVVWYLAGNPWVMEAIPAYLSCLVVMVVVSLLTEHAPDEQVKAAYFEALETDEALIADAAAGRMRGQTQPDAV